MLVPKNQCAGELVMGDKDGGTARLTVQFPHSLPLATAYASLSTVADRVQAISNAVLVSLTIRYKWYEDAPSTPGIGSDVGLYLVLYYSNGVDTEPFYIPAPDESLLETSGDFAGIRLDLGNPAVASLADALSSALGQTVGPDDELWERELVVGGIVR